MSVRARIVIYINIQIVLTNWCPIGSSSFKLHKFKVILYKSVYYEVFTLTLEAVTSRVLEITERVFPD